MAIQVLTFVREENSVIVSLEYFFVNLVISILIAAMVYANNFFFIPRFFDKKAYFLYLICILAWLLISSFGLQEAYHFLFSLFPHIYTTNTGEIVHISYLEVLFVNALFLIGFMLAKFANDFFSSEERLRSIERKQIESELNFLKAQINPHFLFNTLNSIYALSLKKSDEAPEVVLKLSDLLRYMLYECETESILLEKELHVLRSYIELEKIRLKDKNAISIEVEGDPAGKFMAPLLWIPFVENAIKHGLNTRASDGYVRIHIQISEQEISFRCENNYSPVQSAGNRVGGIGIENTRKRLALIYPNRHQLQLRDENQIFSVTLIIQNTNR